MLQTITGLAGVMQGVMYAVSQVLFVGTVLVSDHDSWCYSTYY